MKDEAAVIVAVGVVSMKIVPTYGGMKILPFVPYTRIDLIVVGLFLKLRQYSMRVVDSISWILLKTIES